VKYDERYLQELKLRSEVTISKPVTYSFAFIDYGQWANFTINESTGEFSIQSDWGDWSYRWHTDSLGKDVKLTKFLLKASPDYITEKLSYGPVLDLKDVVDDEETLKAIRKHICEVRRARDIDKGDARDYWLEAETFVEEQACNLDVIDSGLYEFLGEPWEYVAHKKSHRYMFLTRRLIPFFQSWLRDHAQL